MLTLLTLLFFTIQGSQAAQDVYTLCKHGFGYTWDDGPWIYHQEILDSFNAVNGTTTFFMNGDNYSCIYDEDNVRRLRATFESGHQIGSHTWSHASLPTLTDAQIDMEIQRLDEAFIRILGVKPRFIRPPFGDLSEHVITYIRKKHHKYIVMWSDDSLDSVGGTAQDSYNFYKTFAIDRPDYTGLTLSHETSDAGIQALRNGTVNVLANADINLLSVAQCVDMEPYEYFGGYQERDASWTCEGSWTPSNFSTLTRTSMPSRTTMVSWTRSISTETSRTSDVFTEPPLPEGTTPVQITSLTRWDVSSSIPITPYSSWMTFSSTPTAKWTPDATATPTPTPTSDIATEAPLPEGTIPTPISSFTEEPDLPEGTEPTILFSMTRVEVATPTDTSTATRCTPRYSS